MRDLSPHPEQKRKVRSLRGTSHDRESSAADLRTAGHRLRKYAPELAEELSCLIGRCRGNAHLVRRRVLVGRDDVGCAAFAGSGTHTADGYPLFGRNWDYRPEAARGTRVCRPLPARGLAHLGFTNHPIGRYGGINESGLTVATAIVPARPRGDGLRFTLITRRILDCFHGVGEACRFLQSVPHASAVNYLLMDRGGRIARVEAEPGRVQVDTPRGFAAVSNHFSSEPPESARPRLPKSRARVQRLHQWFRAEAGQIASASARHILSDRRGGICAPGDPSVQHATVTLWSWIARPGCRAVQAAEGSPHRTPFHTVLIPRRIRAD